MAFFKPFKDVKDEILDFFNQENPNIVGFLDKFSIVEKSGKFFKNILAGLIYYYQRLPDKSKAKTKALALIKLKINDFTAEDLTSEIMQDIDLISLLVIKFGIASKLSQSIFHSALKNNSSPILNFCLNQGFPVGLAEIQFAFQYGYMTTALRLIAEKSAQNNDSNDNLKPDLLNIKDIDIRQQVEKQEEFKRFLLEELYGDNEVHNSPGANRSRSNPFCRQFIKLIEQLIKWAEEQQMNASINNLQTVIDFMLDIDPEHKWAGRDSGFYAGIKQNIEHICFAIFTLPIPDEFKKAKLQELAVQLTMCPPGAYTSTELIREAFELPAGIPALLANLRADIITSYSEFHMRDSGVPNGNFPHVLYSFMRYVSDKRWKPAGMTMLEQEDELAAAGFTLIQDDDLVNFEEYFITNYTVETMVSSIYEALLTDINKNVYFQNIKIIESALLVKESVPAGYVYLWCAEGNWCYQYSEERGCINGKIDSEICTSLNKLNPGDVTQENILQKLSDYFSAQSRALIGDGWLPAIKYYESLTQAYKHSAFACYDRENIPGELIETNEDFTLIRPNKVWLKLAALVYLYSLGEIKGDIKHHQLSREASKLSVFEFSQPSPCCLLVDHSNNTLSEFVDFVENNKSNLSIIEDHGGFLKLLFKHNSSAYMEIIYNFSAHPALAYVALTMKRNGCHIASNFIEQNYEQFCMLILHLKENTQLCKLALELKNKFGESILMTLVRISPYKYLNLLTELLEQPELYSFVLQYQTSERSAITYLSHLYPKHYIELVADLKKHNKQELLPHVLGISPQCNITILIGLIENNYSDYLDIIHHLLDYTDLCSKVLLARDEKQDFNALYSLYEASPQDYVELIFKLFDRNKKLGFAAFDATGNEQILVRDDFSIGFPEQYKALIEGLASRGFIFDDEMHQQRTSRLKHKS